VGAEEPNPIREITLAVSRKGRVNILEWAYSKGFDFDATAVVDDYSHC
jgi:hypothetical protein